MHRARSSFEPPPRVQRPALRGLRGTRGASKEAATGSVLRFPGRDGHQLPPDGRCRRPPRAVLCHLRHARPLRRRRLARRSRGDHARRRGTRRRRLRAARRRAGAGDRDPPPVRPPHAGDGHGRARLVLRPQGLRLRGAGRARQVLVRRRLRPGRRRGRGRLRHGRLDRERRRGATAASGCGASRTTASRRWPRRSAGIPPSPASRPATSAPTGAASGTAAVRCSSTPPATGRSRWTTRSTPT